MLALCRDGRIDCLSWCGDVFDIEFASWNNGHMHTVQVHQIRGTAACTLGTKVVFNVPLCILLHYINKETLRKPSSTYCCDYNVRFCSLLKLLFITPLLSYTYPGFLFQTSFSRGPLQRSSAAQYHPVPAPEYQRSNGILYPGTCR